ncbi:endonuclease/exonuclease/phosphatase family metal-dependent hydrolase [Streptomonospora nanhaiensis]|uniref:Endonuclease/exonuclease/phosphatase family metal-dependent hydrolase n=1 Tax=Streptomonospora nanhaiensis TaxID=1323731 RepID=A0A853BR37_9ACTN|nr:endonuclease/exonuclease/phosphatase family protein [Streptomonospora nanhaiensis]NYI97633.1 endonuclease/exonuclease/phosphatase family metal-dependent hydrolase [Streptomonospora nanhaiensis]
MAEDGGDGSAGAAPDRPRSRGLVVACANVAGGRLVDEAGDYAPGDRTERFAAALARHRPEIVAVSELDCTRGSRQLNRLVEGLGWPEVHAESRPASDSHIPGVGKLGIGIASRYPLSDLRWIEVPPPPLRFLHWRTGKELKWHPKGMLLATAEGPFGAVRIASVQVPPLHMGRDESGRVYSYDRGPGLAYRERLRDFLDAALRGPDGAPLRRTVILGDMNMPTPEAVFTDLAGARLRDGFGSGPPPATTPDGRSIDRAFVTDDLRVREGGTIAMPPENGLGPDHYPCVFDVRPRAWEADRVRALARRRTREALRPAARRPGPPTDPRPRLR